MTPWIYIMGVCGWWAAGAVFIALVCRVINFSKFTKELREIQRTHLHPYRGRKRHRLDGGDAELNDKGSYPIRFLYACVLNNTEGGI